METEHTHFEEFFVWWLMTTAISIVLGAVIANGMIRVILPLLFVPSNHDFSTIYYLNRLLVANITGACIGLCCGLSQWLLLRAHLTHDVRWWIWATTAGWHLGFVVNEILFITNPPDFILPGLLASAVLGFCQSFVIYKLRLPPLWWIFTQVICATFLMTFYRFNPTDYFVLFIGSSIEGIGTGLYWTWSLKNRL